MSFLLNSMVTTWTDSDLSPNTENGLNAQSNEMKKKKFVKVFAIG